MIAIIVVTMSAMLISCWCSLVEAAFYAITASKIEELRAKGNPGAIRLARMRANIDEPITAILTLNTVVHTLGASLGGSLVQKYYGSSSSYAPAIYGFLFTIVLLYLAEIVPKILGVMYAERVATATAWQLDMTISALRPFVMVSQVVTRALRRGKKAGEDGPSEQEILALAEMGARAGTILPDEARWAANALRLNDVKARELMTPRTVVYVLPADLPLSMVSKHSEHWSYSRLPVVRNNDPDQVEGIVHRRDVFDELALRDEAELKGRTLRHLARPAHYVPETLPCNELLPIFLDNQQQLLIVTNEYGGMEGVIALEDILEFLLGAEIVDPHDKHIDMQEVARRKAKRRTERIASSGTGGGENTTPVPR